MRKPTVLDISDFEETQKLKPCPFCGNKNIFAVYTEPLYYIACLNSGIAGCGARTDYYGDKKEAIKGWNKREDNL